MRQYSAIFALPWGNSTGTHSSVPQCGRFDSLVSPHWKEFSCCLWSCKLQLTAAVARGSSHLLLLFKDVWWIWNGLVKFREACKYTLAVISGGRNFAKRVKKNKRLSLKQFLESSGSAKTYKVVKKSLSFAWLVNLWIISCVKSRHWYKIVFPRPLTPTQSWSSSKMHSSVCVAVSSVRICSYFAINIWHCLLQQSWSCRKHNFSSHKQMWWTAGYNYLYLLEEPLSILKILKELYYGKH